MSKELNDAGLAVGVKSSRTLRCTPGLGDAAWLNTSTGDSLHRLPRVGIGSGKPNWTRDVCELPLPSLEKLITAVSV